MCVCVELCPPDVGDIVGGWSWDFAGGRPVNKLLAALRNRDAYEITEENPPVRAVVLANDAKRVFMGREGDLLVSFVVYGRKAIRQPELDCGGAVWEFQDVVSDHTVNWANFALGRRFL